MMITFVPETSTWYLTLSLIDTEEIQFLKIVLSEKYMNQKKLTIWQIFWRIKYSKAKQHTFRQNHAPGFLQRHLDYLFISNNIQEFILDIDIIPAISSDHSSILISFSKKKKKKSYGFWKFNNSLLSENIWEEKLKQCIKNIKNNNEVSNHPQIKWKFLKYQILNFTIRFSKMGAKEEQKQSEELEANLILLAKNFWLRKTIVFTINVNEISIKYMIILRKEYASEAGVSGITLRKESAPKAGVSGLKKVKNPQKFSKILKNLMERKVIFVRL